MSIQPRIRFVLLALLGAGLVTFPGRVTAGVTGQGDLYVQSTPPGGTVVVDGSPTSVVTPTLLRGLAEGQHEIRVVKGCEAGRSTVEVKPRVVTRMDLPLGPTSGDVQVATTPSGVQVTVDGIVRGQAPLLLDDLPCGSHQLALALTGFHDATRTVEVAPWSSQDLSVVMEARALGTLVVVPDPIDARILVDGVVVGVGAMTLEGLAAGVHEVALEREGFPTQRRSIQVTCDDVVRLELSLTPPWPFPPGTKPPTVEPHPDRGPLVRRIVAGGLAGAGLGFAALGTLSWADASSAYDQYLAIDEMEDAEAWYDQEVVPRRNVIYVDLTAAVALIGTATGLFLAPSHDAPAPTVVSPTGSQGGTP